MDDESEEREQNHHSSSSTLQLTEKQKMTLKEKPHEIFEDILLHISSLTLIGGLLPVKTF